MHDVGGKFVFVGSGVNVFVGVSLGETAGGMVSVKKLSGDADGICVGVG